MAAVYKLRIALEASPNKPDFLHALPDWKDADNA